MDILKHGKRFHATVSFDTDTGLKQALATVADYNPLMKDFPINDLLSATELEKIRPAVQQIFSHLRKVRNTKYPIQRCLKLIEAISRDLSQQLLKVLGTRRLMHIPFDEFERVMNQCFEIFSCWDDEYDKLQGLLRDIVKKKRDEHLKMVWRVSPAHKKLQTRMEHMRKFRRQHEQLRTVILRVLRPNKPAVSEDGTTAETKQPYSLDAADANAIEEVNLAYENVKEVDCLDITKEGSEAWEAAVKRYEEKIGGYSCFKTNLEADINIFQLFVFRSRGNPHHSSPARPARNCEERQRNVPHLLALQCALRATAHPWSYPRIPNATYSAREGRHRGTARKV